MTIPAAMFIETAEAEIRKAGPDDPGRMEAIRELTESGVWPDHGKEDPFESGYWLGLQTARALQSMGTKL